MHEIPLKIRETYPNNQDTSDLKIIVKASNYKDYAVKTIKDGNRLIPATELFCYELANLIDIATPNYRIIEMKDSTLAFGSEWEGGVKSLDQVLDKNGKVDVPNFTDFASKLYALDIFINNVDRHFANYLFRESYNGNLISLAFDFSKAWYANNDKNPFSFDCFDESSNTHVCKLSLREDNNLDFIIVENTLDRISTINPNKIEEIFVKTPLSWLDNSKKSYIIDWWKNKMTNRIDELKDKI